SCAGAGSAVGAGSWAWGDSRRVGVHGRVGGVALGGTRRQVRPCTPVGGVHAADSPAKGYPTDPSRDGVRFVGRPQAGAGDVRVRRTAAGQARLYGVQWLATPVERSLLRCRSQPEAAPRRGWGPSAHADIERSAGPGQPAERQASALESFSAGSRILNSRRNSPLIRAKRASSSARMSSVLVLSSWSTAPSRNFHLRIT